MFKNFFKSNKVYEPLDYEIRKYFENNILWLENEFPVPALENRKIFLPTTHDFPIKWNNSKENAIEVLKIITDNMQIDFNEIEIDFYTEGVVEMNSGMNTIFLENSEDDTFSSGLYFNKNNEGRYEISINETNLKNPTALIATISHELSHIKLLGENKIDENDEYLTDLTTVFFGFGVFSANASFQFYQEYDRWGYIASGYLKAEEWAYCLALLAFIREEDNPEWSNHLNPMIKKEFDLCLKYMIENKEEIFKFEDNTENDKQ